MLNKLKEGHWPIFLLSSISSMANLFLPIILVRILAPSDIGLYKIFFLHLGAIPFILMSGGPINSVYYWVGKSKPDRDKLIQSAWLLSVLLSSLVFIIGLPTLYFISKHLNFPVEYTLLMIICGFLWCPGSYFSETNIAKGKTAYGALFSAGFEILKVCSFIILAVLFKDIGYLFYAFASILVIKFLITIIVGLKQNTVKFEVNPKHLKTVWKYCLPISASGALGFFVDKIDQLLLASFLNSADFAFYSMGCLIVPPLIMIDMSVQKVLIPKLAANYEKNNFSVAAEYFKKAISDIAFLIIPAVFGLAYFAEPITKLLYTEQYLASVPFLQVFAISYLLYCIPHDAVPRATGHTSWIFKIYMVVTPISLVTVFLAASYSTALATLTMAITVKFIPKIAGLAYSKKVMNWSWREMFPTKRIIAFTGLSTILCLISELVSALFSNDLIWFLVCAPVFAIVYLGITIFAIKRHNRD
ncbi:MAG: O-antigen/teichoic acid export membrane protein [Bacteriovoracaceae bacterium]|jgi:O-antigen/teichoic acid export membrane protein